MRRIFIVYLHHLPYCSVFYFSNFERATIAFSFLSKKMNENGFKEFILFFQIYLGIAGRKKYLINDNVGYTLWHCGSRLYMHLQVMSYKCHLM